MIEKVGTGRWAPDSPTAGQEEAMTTAHTRRAIIMALNDCIEINTDAEKGYALAAADVRDPTLKARFLARVKERADFVLALQDAIHRMGATPENEGTMRGAIHRGFTGISRIARGRNDAKIVEQCVRGERAALDGYEAALRRVFFRRLPPELKAMVEAQYSSIKRSLDYLRESFAA
jgi:uncharacterized protein (TIGR02284 family)